MTLSRIATRVLALAMLPLVGFRKFNGHTYYRQPGDGHDDIYHDLRPGAGPRVDDVMISATVHSFAGAYASTLVLVPLALWIKRTLSGYNLSALALAALFAMVICGLLGWPSNECSFVQSMATI